MTFDSIEQALARPTNDLFWVEYANGKALCGHADSFYAPEIPDKYLVYDVGNNKVLANVELNGTVQRFSFYRGCYPSDSLAPGIWWFKDHSEFGPFRFHLRLGDETFDLAETDWPLRTDLLGNILPRTTLTGPGVAVTLISYAPISADGAERPRALIYGLMLRNTSDEPITGAVIPPKSQSSDEAGAPVHETFTAVLDGVACHDGEVPFELMPGETLWTPAVITPVPGQVNVADVAKRTALDWLNETLGYFHNMLGELSMPADPFPAAFFERSMLECFLAIAMDESGEMVGANWSGFPSTMQIWQKDLYHSCAPLGVHEPELMQQIILWFLYRSVRHKGDKIYGGYHLDGGVSFSLTNTLTPVVQAGAYYEATGNRAFFEAHPEVMARSCELLEAVLETREGEPVLFPSMWLSDGPSRGDYNTGSNVVAWLAFNLTAVLVDDIAGDAALAARYRDIADRIHADIDTWCITDGPLGPQYTEGAFKDGTHETHHDGEETDTTLMPHYGYCAYDNTAHQNHARVAMTEDNTWYRQCSRGIKDSTWLEDPDPPIEATYPGYMTGLAGVANAEEMSGPDGAMTIIRQRTDVDGSIWWWPFCDGHISRAYEIHGGVVGKSGWAAGVYACHFVSQILGLSYHGPSRTLRWRPFSPTSNFTWTDCRLGAGRFSADFTRDDTTTRCSITNHNDHDVTAELEIILPDGATAASIQLDGQSFDGSTEAGTFFEATTVKLSVGVPAGTGCTIEAIC